MDHDFYWLFSRFWWLLFPLFWAIGRAIRLYLDHQRAGQALELVKAYADQGKEIPPELLKVLQQPTASYGGGPFRSPREKARGLLIPGIAFVGMAAAFSVLIIGKVEGNDPEAFWGMMFVVTMLLGFAAAFFITSYLYSQDAKRLDPP